MELNAIQAGTLEEILIRMADKIQRNYEIPKEQEEMIIELSIGFLGKKPEQAEDYLKTIEYADVLRHIADSIEAKKQISENQERLLKRASKEILFGPQKRTGTFGKITAVRIIDEDER